MPEQFGKYDILGELGAGGMAVVFKARDTLLRRIVALKVIHRRLQDGEYARKRFLNEGRAAAALSHPNIVAIYELGIEDGQPFIAMEYLSGVDLREILDARTPLGLRQKLDIALEVAKALEHAHARGVIHRDIKPGNIRVAEDGHVRLMDFGIAKVTSEEVTRLTRTGSVVGTLAYMSPEQLRGESPTEAADVFAFGVVLYELLAGKRAFEGPHSPAVMHQVLYSEPTPIADSGIPDALLRLVHDCLKKSAQERTERFPRIVEVLSQVKRELPEAEDPRHDWMAAPTSAALSVAALRGASGGSESTWGAQAGPSVQPRRRRTVVGAVLVPGLLVTMGFVLFAAARLGDREADSGASQPAPSAPSPLQARTPNLLAHADVHDLDTATENGASTPVTPGVAAVLREHAPASVEVVPTVLPEPPIDARLAAQAATPTRSSLERAALMFETRPKTRQRAEAPSTTTPSPALLTPNLRTALGKQQPDAGSAGTSRVSAPPLRPPAADRSPGPSLDVEPEATPYGTRPQAPGVRELRVRAPEGTQICLDGRVADASRAGVSWSLSGVSAGHHVLRLIHPAKGTAEGTIVVQPETDVQRVIFEDSDWKAPGFRVTFQSTDRGVVPFEGRAGEDYRVDLGGGQAMNLRLQLAGAPAESAELSIERGDGLQSTVRCVRGASGRGCQGPPWFECGAVR